MKAKKNEGKCCFTSLVPFHPKSRQVRDDGTEYGIFLVSLLFWEVKYDRTSQPCTQGRFEGFHQIPKTNSLIYDYNTCKACSYKSWQGSKANLCCIVHRSRNQKAVAVQSKTCRCYKRSCWWQKMMAKKFFCTLCSFLGYCTASLLEAL